MVTHKIIAVHHTSTNILTETGYHTIVISGTKEEEPEPAKLDLYRDKRLPRWMKRR